MSPTVPDFDIYCCYDYDLFAGAYGCILVLCVWYLCGLRPLWWRHGLYICVWWLGMRACSPSHFWELATPPIWGHPSYCIWYSEDSPPNTWLRWCDTVCLNICLAWGKLLTPTFTLYLDLLSYSFTLYFLWYSWPYLLYSFRIISLLSFDYIYISVHWAL